MKITKLRDEMPKGWPKTISTKNPDMNANNILVFDGIAIAQYIFISNIHSGAIYPKGNIMRVSMRPKNNVSKIINIYLSLYSSGVTITSLIFSIYSDGSTKTCANLSPSFILISTILPIFKDAINLPA